MKTPALFMSMYVCIIAQQSAERPKFQKIEMECRNPGAADRAVWMVGKRENI